MKRAAYITATLLACVLPACAATPLDCWKLRRAGRNAQSCFEKLTQSSNADDRAEGLSLLDCIRHLVVNMSRKPTGELVGNKAEDDLG